MPQLDFITFLLQVAVMFILSWSIQSFIMKRILPSSKTYLIKIIPTFIFLSGIFVFIIFFFKLKENNINYDTYLETTNIVYNTVLLYIILMVSIHTILHVFISLQNIYCDYLHINYLNTTSRRKTLEVLLLSVINYLTNKTKKAK